MAPCTGWLGGLVDLDDHGFVRTGPGSDGAGRSLLETSQPGIFAVGDVRAGSAKRVATGRRRGRDGDPACFRANTPHLGGNGDARDGHTKFERSFRAAGCVDVDWDGIKRYLDFVNDALYDLLLIGQATAKANVRDVILPWDLPVTKGLQESVHTREWERAFELFRLLI